MDPIEQSTRLGELRRKVAESEAKNREAKAQKEQDYRGTTSTEIVAGPIEVAKEAVNDETRDSLSLHPDLDAGEEYDSDILEQTSSESSSIVSSDSSSEPGPDDDDETPEEITSKLQAAAPSDKEAYMCKYFTASGYCRNGSNCRFKHEQPQQRSQDQSHAQRRDQGSRVPQTRSLDTGTERKSIFQRLVEQEQNGEDRLALQVIKYLGKAGFFKEQSSIDELE